MKDKPAFPANYGSQLKGEDGMSLYQYTCIKAMQGLLANSSLNDLDVSMIANDSVMYAKALLNEMEKEER